MLRMTFLFFAALLTKEALSFGIQSNTIAFQKSSVRQSSSLYYSSSATLSEPTTKGETSTRNLSTLFTAQIARQFSAAQRYAVAAVVLGDISEDISEDFYYAEEDQRMQAIQLVEYANRHDILLADYRSQIELPLEESLGSQAFSQVLLLREQQDRLAFEQLLVEAGKVNQDLVQFLEPIRMGQVEWDQALILLLGQVMPSIDTNKSLLNPKADDAMSDVTSRFNYLPKSEESLREYSPLDHPLIEEAYKQELQVDQVPSAPFLQQLQMHLRWMEPTVARAGHATTTDYIGAAVYTDYDALTEGLPSTEEILQVVDNSASELATFLEQTDFVDSIQQSLSDDLVLVQIVEFVSQIY
jgi:hypothetical protein